jgi:hypothetical protein
MEIEEKEIDAWEACADMLFAWADELKCGTTSQAIYEAVCVDIEKYRKLKNETQSNELTELEKIEQILGKALGYPWYKDDPDIFPKATEADGVCVGVETAWSLAMIAADKIKELEERNKKLSKRHPTKEEALAQYNWLKENSKRNK